MLSLTDAAVLHAGDPEGRPHPGYRHSGQAELGVVGHGDASASVLKRNTGARGPKVSPWRSLPGLASAMTGGSKKRRRGCLWPPQTLPPLPGVLDLGHLPRLASIMGPESRHRPCRCDLRRPRPGQLVHVLVVDLVLDVKRLADAGLAGVAVLAGHAAAHGQV